MAKIKVMSAGAVEGPVSELAPEFTRASGHEVDLHFNTVGAHRERFVGGEKTDVIILSFPAIEALDKEGRFVAGSRADLGRASCGVAVRDGMMMPNISTVEGFKRMLKFAGLDCGQRSGAWRIVRHLSGRLVEAHGPLATRSARS